jgi:hypothetical protein
VRLATAAGLARRVVAELTSTPSGDDVARALASLRVRRVDGALCVGRTDPGAHADAGEPLDASLAGEPAGVVRFAEGAYASVPTAAARAALLARARRAATEHVELHVCVTADASHLGRATFDAPRRLLGLAGLRVAEPGDRFGPPRYTHCFFDEEALRDEIATAGLVVAGRRGFTFTLVASAGRAPPVERAAPFAVELARAARLAQEVDARRRGESPERAVAGMRARGRACPARGPVGRARLQRAIGWVDALARGGPSCYRRVLLELGLDAGAATETLLFGLDVGRTGHVAFEGREPRSFDVCFAIDDRAAPAPPP